MSDQNVLLEKRDYAAIVTINRPNQLNALNIDTIRELHTMLVQVNNDPEVRAVIITGSGDKAFVAGADIKEFMDFSVHEGQELAASGQELLFDLLENFHKPVIAAVNGFALGGGLELAMACHLRVASHNAKLGLPETSLGVIPGYGGTQRLARLIGYGRALEMIVTADMIGADRAYDMGLVNHTSSQLDLIDTCMNIAGKIARNSPQAVASAIRSVNAGFADKSGFEEEINEFGRCFGTDDFKEGTRAFLEKRKPSFNG
jgi:enoyl-CoA hydratase